MWSRLYILSHWWYTHQEITLTRKFVQRMECNSCEYHPLISTCIVCYISCHHSLFLSLSLVEKRSLEKDITFFLFLWYISWQKDMFSSCMNILSVVHVVIYDVLYLKPSSSPHAWLLLHPKHLTIILINISQVLPFFSHRFKT